MSQRTAVSAEAQTITVQLPFTFRKRGGRKLVVTPDGAARVPSAAGDREPGSHANAVARISVIR
jgi:hypothetical protein